MLPGNTTLATGGIMEKKNKIWLVMFATCLMVFLANVDFTIVNLAIPSMASDFKATLSQLQWIISSYLIAAFIFFMIGGRYADLYGRKRIFLIGTALFLIGCLGAAFAKNLLFLDAMRFTQGVGFAFTLSLALLINTELFPEHKKGLAIGITIAITGISQAIGPVLGGVIIQWMNWRWIFGYAVPLSLLSFVFIFFFYTQAKVYKTKRESFWAGVLNKAIWKNRPFFFITLIRAFFMFNWAVLLFSFPIYLERGHYLSPFKTGLMILLSSSVMAVISPFAGYLMDRFGTNVLITIATVLTTLSFMSLSHINAGTSLWLVGGMLLLFGAAAGLMLPASVKAAIQTLPKQSAGIGLGLFFSANFLVSAVGVSIAALILNHTDFAENFFSIVSFQWVIWVSLLLSFTSLFLCLRFKK